MTSAAVGNRKGYAGYEQLTELAGSAWDVRNRVLISELGTWNRRDPLGYVDGMNLYAYVTLMPIVMSDAWGEIATAHTGGFGGIHAGPVGGPCGVGGSAIAGVGGGCGGNDEDGGGSAFSSLLINDSLTTAIRNCMKHPTNCLRYRCIEPLVDSFNQFCGGCLDGYVKHLRTLINLWCLRGSPGKAKKSFCDAQYAIMKPACDSCGKCLKTPMEARCTAARPSALCWTICIGWYEWYDTVSPQGKPPKINPSKHQKKIEDMKNAHRKCANLIAKCR